MKKMFTFSISDNNYHSCKKCRMNFLRRRKFHEHIHRGPSAFSLECILQYARSVQGFVTGNQSFLQVMN